MATIAFIPTCSALARRTGAQIRRQMACALRVLSHLSTPDFKGATADTFKSVKVALFAFRLYSKQTHFHVAMRAEKQRLCGC